MNRLLIVTTVSDTLQAFLIPFSFHFRNQGWQVDAMSLNVSSEPACLEAFDQVWDVDFARNPLFPQNILVATRQIQKILSQQDYDIVHVHTAVASFVTRYALKNLKKASKPKVIYTVHGFSFYYGGNPLNNTLILSLEKLAGRWTDYMIVINREDEERAQQHRLVPFDRIRYMPGIGVDTRYYNRDTVPQSKVEQIRQELGLEPNNPLFLSVAELIYRKRPQDILRAFARLGRPEACLAFVGSGSLMNQMKHLAFKLGIESQVRFLGFRKDIPTLMCASVATVLASRQEGLPRCVMESLCLETPVIGSDIRGTRDLLKDGCGLLVTLGDIEGFEKAMVWVLNHPEDARQMGKQGRACMDQYELERIIKLHESLYVEAIEDHPDGY